MLINIAYADTVHCRQQVTVSAALEETVRLLIQESRHLVLTMYIAVIGQES